MILPAPLKPGQEIRLLDLSNDGFSFDKLSHWFPVPMPVRLLHLFMFSSFSLNLRY